MTENFGLSEKLLHDSSTHFRKTNFHPQYFANLPIKISKGEIIATPLLAVPGVNDSNGPPYWHVIS